MSTKIHATVDALGNPSGFHLTGGQASDLEGADTLLPTIEAEAVLADKAYNADSRVIEPMSVISRGRVGAHLRTVTILGPPPPILFLPTQAVSESYG